MKSRTFHTLWTKFAKAADREERLRWCAAQLGRAVESTKELSDADFDLLIAELRRLMRQGSGRVVSMRGRSVDSASDEQVWKVAQLEAWMGWRPVPERLRGFLADKFHGCERASQLSARDAWRAIEALIGVAAQEAVKGLPAGERKAAKRAEVKRIKEVLRTWRPGSDAA